MPKIDESKEAEIKREIKIAMAIDPLISSRRLQKRLWERGMYASTAGRQVDINYILKLVRKINAEAKNEIRNEEIENRMSETRERFKVIFDRLFKIAFWEWDYLHEGIAMPEVKDQIKAMETIMKMDIALIEAEMDAGIFKRNLGTLELESRNRQVTPERKQAIRVAMRNWGLFAERSPNENELVNGNQNERSAAEPATAQ